MHEQHVVEEDLWWAQVRSRLSARRRGTASYHNVNVLADIPVRMRLDDLLDCRPGVQFLAGRHDEAILDGLGTLVMKVRERVPRLRRVAGTPDLRRIGAWAKTQVRIQGSHPPMSLLTQDLHTYLHYY